MNKFHHIYISIGIVLLLLSGCSPVIRVEPSDKPITINMNITIEHEIRVKIDKELDALFDEDSELF